MVGVACNALTALHMAAGDLDAAVAAGRETHTIGRETGQAQLELSGAWYLSDVAATRGERDACLAYLAQAEACLLARSRGSAGTRLPVCSADCTSVWESRSPRARPSRPVSTSTSPTPSASAPAPSSWQRHMSVGRPAAATETLDRVAPRVQQAWGFAALDRCRGLLASEFDAPFRQSIDRSPTSRFRSRRPAPGSVTANGSAAPGVASTPASNCAPASRRSSGCACSHGPNGRATSFVRRERHFPFDPPETWRNDSRPGAPGRARRRRRRKQPRRCRSALPQCQDDRSAPAPRLPASSRSSRADDLPASWRSLHGVAPRASRPSSRVRVQPEPRGSRAASRAARVIQVGARVPSSSRRAHRRRAAGRRSVRYDSIRTTRVSGLTPS